MNFSYIYLVFYLILQDGVLGQDVLTTPDPEEDIKWDETQAYCFRLTWLGPSPNENLQSCDQINKDSKLKNTPCRQPLVITEPADRPPDMDYLFKHYRNRVLCKRRGGQSCVKYSYYFNDQLQNVTYMCAKVVSKGEGAVTGGCWTERDSGRATEACVCRSTPGVKPCNKAHTVSLQYHVLISLLLLVYLLNK